MVITGQGWLTYLVSQNKHIRLWHQKLAHASNVKVVNASKFIDSINLGLEKKYNSVEVFVHSEKSDENDADNLENYSNR